jgi:hypothetical protein
MAMGGRTDLAWLNQFRRPQMRYEKRTDLHEAFLSLGCALIFWNAIHSARVGFEGHTRRRLSFEPPTGTFTERRQPADTTKMESQEALYFRSRQRARWLRCGLLARTMSTPATPMAG